MEADNESKKEQSAHLEHSGLVKNGAQQASEAEHQASFWEALKTNRKAVLWSAAISLTIIMEGYDVGRDNTSPQCGFFIFFFLRKGG